jgi:hypothetical protein
MEKQVGPSEAGPLEPRHGREGIASENFVDAIGIPGSSDAIVLCERGPSSRDRNLLRVRADGTILWIAPAPPSFGSYCKIMLEDSVLVAWTWSCYRLRIDLETGDAIDVTFTK